MLTRTLQTLVQRLVVSAGRRFLTHVVCGALFVLTMTAAPQHAEAEATVVHSYIFEDGSWIIVMYDAEHDEFGWLYYNAAGELEEGGTINPDPENGTTTPSDFDGLLDLLLQAGGELAGPAFEETPLGHYLTGKGQGLGPRYNPSGETGGMSPGAVTFRNPEEVAIGEVFGPGGPGGIDSEGGPAGEQVTSGVKKGGNGNGNGNGGSGNRRR